MSGLVVRHVADVQEAEDVSDVEALDEFLHLLAYGLRTARDHVAILEEILPGESRELGEGVFGERGERAVLEGLDRPIARRIREAGEDVEAAVVEVVEVLG